jgi:hypothetical protein
MSNSYTSRARIAKPARSDRNWDIPVNANSDLLDAINAIGAGCVTPTEIPSVSLNVTVASCSYQKQDGSVGAFPGATSQIVTASSTTVLYLDATGTLTTAVSYPSAAHTKLGTVVAGVGTILSITDDRMPLPLSLSPAGGILVNAASDGAAASGGVPIGGFYRTGNAVQVRLA